MDRYTAHQLKHHSLMLCYTVAYIKHNTRTGSVEENRLPGETPIKTVPASAARLADWQRDCRKRHKLVVEARLKGAGMHWKRENVDPMLALRNIVCSDRWAQEWPKVEQRLQQQATHRRKALRTKHCQTAQSLETPQPETVTPDVPEKISVSETCTPTDNMVPSTQRTEPWRPAPNHPWRHSPIGKARFQPSTPAKN